MAKSIQFLLECLLKMHHNAGQYKIQQIKQQMKNTDFIFFSSYRIFKAVNGRPMTDGKFKFNVLQRFYFASQIEGNTWKQKLRLSVDP